MVMEVGLSNSYEAPVMPGKAPADAILPWHRAPAGHRTGVAEAVVC